MAYAANFCGWKLAQIVGRSIGRLGFWLGLVLGCFYGLGLKSSIYGAGFLKIPI